MTKSTDPEAELKTTIGVPNTNPTASVPMPPKVAPVGALPAAADVIRPPVAALPDATDVLRAPGLPDANEQIAVPRATGPIHASIPGFEEALAAAQPTLPVGISLPPAPAAQPPPPPAVSARPPAQPLPPARPPAQPLPPARPPAAAAPPRPAVVPGTALVPMTITLDSGSEGDMELPPAPTMESALAESALAAENTAAWSAAQNEIHTMIGPPQSISKPPPGSTPAPKPALATDPSVSKPATGSKPPTGSGVKEITQPALKPQDLGPGLRIHHYELIKLIGRGGMGSVYLARDTRLGRKVAIKFLSTQSDDLTKRFILEARTTAACSHENIVVIFEVDAWQGAPFMVFEFIQGQPLTKLMPEGKPLPPPRVVELVVPVVRALAFAHSQGIVHRDLKPDNVMVTDTGVTKVLDFGIAKVLQGDEKAPEYVTRPRAPKSNMEDHTTAELTEHGAMMGTLTYMAPEQWGIGVPIDHRADIWSVGIMLFKMLAGKHPLDPLRGQQLMVTGLLNEPMPKLSTMAPDVPSGLAEVVDRCLLKHKDKRWPDAVTLLRALEPFLPGRYSRDLKMDESPYAGLSSFQEADADRFFGRAQEVAAMVNRVRERPMLGVIGPSGAGKSSFVRAGLVPALKRSGEAWEALVLRPGRSPLAALAALVSPMVSTSASVSDELAEEKKLAEKLAAEPGYLGSVLRSRARREKKNLLLFVDQFEELYTLVADPAERKAFTACLAGVADDATAPIRLVLSIRSDFLDRVPEDPRFMAELSQGLVFLGSPGTEGLREAIVQPAELAGYKFESQDTVDDMLKHLAGTQGALPLLQFAAQKLWEARDPARKQLTQKAYEAIGGVAGALAAHADAVIAKLPPASLPLVRAILLRLVTPDRTRAIVSLDELRELGANTAEIQSLVDELVAARLLVIQTGSGVATVEIVHESLLHSWPAMKRWLEESSEDAAFLDQLRTAARQWSQNKKDSNLLWRGELAEEAQRFSRRNRGELAAAQKDFLAAVISEMARGARRKRAATIGVVTVSLAMVAASAVALVVIAGARSEAQKQAAAATLAEAEAVKNLKVAESKEQERAKAAAEAAAETIKAQQAAAELRGKQQELLDALARAEDAAQAAKVAEARAVNNAAEAGAARKLSEEAKLHADSARQEVQGLLAKEKDRAQRLEEQLGSPVIDTLK